MSKSSTDMLIEAGVIPLNAVQQLEHWRAVPEGTAERAGRQAVSLDKDSSEARNFAHNLASQLALEEGAIKETEFSSSGEFKAAWLLWSDGSFAKEPVDVIVDKFKRVHVPVRVMGNGRAKAVKGVSFTERRADLLPVDKVEPRFHGETPSAIVVYLEGFSS